MVHVMLQKKMKRYLLRKNGPAAKLRINQNGVVKNLKVTKKMVKKTEMAKTVGKAKRTRMEKTIRNLQVMKKMAREKEAKKVKKERVPSETSLTKTGLNNT